MPRIVDVDKQRADLAGAVRRIVARSGLEQVSLRSVAAEAGVSMGRVQHYFASKDELLLHSLDAAYLRMERRIEARVQTRVAAGEVEGTDTDRTVLAEILDELLGADPETRDTIRISMAFAVRASDDTRVISKLTEGDDEIVALAVAVISSARDAGLVPAGVDPKLEGRALFTLACGLGAEVALYGASVQAARETLDYHFRRVAPQSPTSAVD